MGEGAVAATPEAMITVNPLAELTVWEVVEGEREADRTDQGAGAEW